MSNRVEVTWHPHEVAREDRERLHGHRGGVVWFTGLSGSGKSTIANEVDRLLQNRRIHSFLLDGDNVRLGLNAAPDSLASTHGIPFAERFGLGFGAMDREENIRRVSAVARLFASAGLVTLTAFVSPYRKDRDAARRAITEGCRPEDFLEVFVNTPLEICESRDPKGLYKKARAGLLKNFTGIDDPYEPPSSPDLELSAGAAPAVELAGEVVQLLIAKGIIPE